MVADGEHALPFKLLGGSNMQNCKMVPEEDSNLHVHKDTTT